jgi:formylglycine-generating enzyme required for sulfatase activity
MVKNKLEFPPDLVESLVKRETVLFAGGDILKAFSLVNEEGWPEKFVESIARTVRYPRNSPKTFFKVSEYAKHKYSNPWLVDQITQRYGDQQYSIDCPPLRALVSTKPRLIVTTWFDDHLLQVLHQSFGENVYPIRKDIDLHYQDGNSDARLVYLFGSARAVETLCTDSRTYQERLDPRTLLHQHITGLLANSTLLFLGYSSSAWFDFEDFYGRLANITPYRHRRLNYAICEERVDEATYKRFMDRDLRIIVPANVEDYTYQLAQKVLLEQTYLGRQSRLPHIPDKPYKYLDYYSSSDAEIFYGRGRDIEHIVGLVLAHRSLVLFGASGVGKTSILEAGVAPALEKKGLKTIRMRVLPDPARALTIALGSDSKTVTPSGHWLPILQSYKRRRNTQYVVLIFDQFEEFFSELSSEIQQAFWEDVAHCIQDADQAVRLIFTIRQEVLYLFKSAFPAIPKPYDIMCGLDSLTDGQKVEAITTPAELYQQPWSKDLVDKLIDDFRRYPGETAHLSIVLSTLWEQRKSSETDIKAYEELGGVEGILTNYLWGAVDKLPNPAQVKQVLKSFVSPERRKSQINIEEVIAEANKRNVELSRAEAHTICNQLLSARLLRSVSGELEIYELSHDVLATTISEEISDEEMQSKFAKRSIREAVQNWKVARRLPGLQEYGQLSQIALDAPLVVDDFMFLCLSAAANGKPVTSWLEYAVREGGSIDNFYEDCVKSESLLAAHEFLRRMRTDYSNRYFHYLEQLSNSDKPSIAFDLENLIALLKDGGHEELNTLDVSLPLTQVPVPKGDFTVGFKGVLGGAATDMAIPEHQIYLDEYVIDRFLVTNLEYKRFVEEAGHRPPEHWVDGVIPYGKEYHPVTRVSWYDAAAYARWQGKRLPTEAEWEKAAYWDQKSKRKYAYPWGDEFREGLANYYDSNIGSTSPIGQFSPMGDSPLGVTDMAGNVFEWLLDDALLPFQPFDSKRNPVHVKRDPNYPKMTRGGSYGGPKEQLHCTYRGYARSPMIMDDYVGFRCVSSPNSIHYDLMLNLLEQLGK